MSLLRQLNELKLGKPQKLNERPSLLFDYKQAAGINRQTIHSLAFKAFQTLPIMEYGHLFSLSSIDGDRLQLVEILID